jgi:hypothetical protein
MIVFGEKTPKKTEKRYKMRMFWSAIKVEDVKKGNFVCGIRSTHPREIDSVKTNDDGTITLFEKGRKTPYLNNVCKNHPLDLLINYNTKKPLNKRQVNRIFGGVL